MKWNHQPLSDHALCSELLELLSAEWYFHFYPSVEWISQCDCWIVHQCWVQLSPFMNMYSNRNSLTSILQNCYNTILILHNDCHLFVAVKVGELSITSHSVSLHQSITQNQTFGHTSFSIYESAPNKCHIFELLLWCFIQLHMLPEWF